ncbi:MAG: hypothetical protein IPM98_21865 [Lewinellaceae bacterium]|nr:hypothetical protein [Lewinellaceae bacterium]
MKQVLFSLLFIACLSSSASAQCVAGNCVDGKGTFVYPSGAKYIGDFKNGEIHGVGVCYYTDNSKYSGEWKNRYPDGKGTKTYSDGTKRTGCGKKANRWMKTVISWTSTSPEKKRSNKTTGPTSRPAA